MIKSQNKSGNKSNPYQDNHDNGIDQKYVNIPCLNSSSET